MPDNTLKNRLYRGMLPIFGKRCQWSKAVGGADQALTLRIGSVLHKAHGVGACIQRLQKGIVTDCYTAGYARLEGEKIPVDNKTIFRTASIAKMVNALLVFRLQTLGKLDVREEVSAFLGYPVQNAYYPDAPITLGMLLNHTSGIVDSPAYYASFAEPGNLRKILSDRATYSGSLPGVQFHYSNLAAGMIGSMLEQRFHQSYEELAQQELFRPLSVAATFDISTLQGKTVADGYRVLPSAYCFNAEKRMEKAIPLEKPDPESHYLLAAGNLYITAGELAKLALAAWNGQNGFLNTESLYLLKNPTADWPRQQVCLRHGMGLLTVEDPSICKKQLWGHQGFAYGAVNGVFFDEEGNGFASLNSGVSEERKGHLALINQRLIQALIG
ncbi:MAG: serine hydrolase [Eubacteriales bacterium]|nr:serine hydrolase [Eubacteriales bacterium]